MKQLVGMVTVSLFSLFTLFFSTLGYTQLLGDSKSGAEPRWVTNVPPSGLTYYFVGSGSANNKSAARKNAYQDALGQVVLTINATISTNNTFSSVYQENDKSDSLMQRAYKKIKVKGRSAVRKFKIKKTYYDRDSKDNIVCYVLAGVPKDEIDGAIKRMEDLRKKLAKTPTAIIVVTVNPYNKRVYQNEKLQGFFEKFYIDQGYNVISDDVDVEKLKGKSAKKNIRRIKKMLGKKFKRLVYVAITPKRFMKETQSGYTFYVVEGNLSVREVRLKDKRILSTQTFSNKGIHRAGLAKALSVLEQNLMDDLLGEDEEEGSLLDY